MELIKSLVSRGLERHLCFAFGNICLNFKKSLFKMRCHYTIFTEYFKKYKIIYCINIFVISPSLHVKVQDNALLILLLCPLSAPSFGKYTWILQLFHENWFVSLHFNHLQSWRITERGFDEKKRVASWPFWGHALVNVMPWTSWEVAVYLLKIPGGSLINPIYVEKTSSFKKFAPAEYFVMLFKSHFELCHQ